MGFLDFFYLLNNVPKVADSKNLIKINFEKFTDKNEYVGERIKSFIGFLILSLFLIILVFGIIFLIFKTIKQS